MILSLLLKKSPLQISLSYESSRKYNSYFFSYYCLMNAAKLSSAVTFPTLGIYHHDDIQKYYNCKNSFNFESGTSLTEMLVTGCVVVS